MVRGPNLICKCFWPLDIANEGAALNLNDYTAQELVDKVQRADSLFYRG